LTSDYFGEAFLTTKNVTIPKKQCTVSEHFGCFRNGTREYPINPIRSARILTSSSFSFKYGTVEVRAKMPAGDWLWPSIQLVPTRKVYGDFPRSGEIDLVESRGNRRLFDGTRNVGVEHVSSNLHYGPNRTNDGWREASVQRNRSPGYHKAFHVYRMVWTPERIRFFIDDLHITTISADNGFWQRGNFAAKNFTNPWAKASRMAPFDQEFHIAINLAVGGSVHFSDNFKNEAYSKTWVNSAKYIRRDFWNSRVKWLPTWNYNKTDEADLQVDYVRVWAL
jgi:beta-glucanase (GH16 family)